MATDKQVNKGIKRPDLYSMAALEFSVSIDELLIAVTTSQVYY